MKTFLRILMLYACTLLIIAPGQSQHLSNMGKDFWIGYGNHVRMVNSANGATPEQMQLYITSDVATSGKVTISGIGFEQTYKVVPKQITTINIPRTAALTGDGLYDLGIHVTAEKPVVVYSFIFVSAISGATVCLPSATLGRDYYSVNFTQAANEDNCFSYFFVVAADTGTTSVEITPAATTKSGRAAKVPFVVQLQQGQVYQVLGSVNGARGSDLTGSRIRSVNTGSGCKKIAVFSGSSKISIGCSSPKTSDNLYQQVYPTATWGQKYIALSSLRNPNNYFRIIRPDPTAVVKINNQVVPANAFTNNFYHQFQGSGTYKIESDKAILVAQYFPTQGCFGNKETGDPEMIFLNPVNQTLKSVTLNSMQPDGINIREHYLNVVVPNTPAAINSFKLDGVAVAGLQPLPSDSSFAYARIRTVKGTHNLDCDSGFNVIAYGFGEAESYGYSGGARLRNLYQFAAVQNEYLTLDYAATNAGAPFRLSMAFPYQPQTISWRFGGVLPDVDMVAPKPDSVWRTNGTLVYRYSIPGWLKAPPEGTYNVKLIVSNGMGDGCTTEEEIEHELLVHPAAKASFNLKANSCFGDSVIVKEGYTANNKLDVMRWLWNFGNGDTAMRAAPAPRYGAAGKYDISFAVINEIGVITDTAFGEAVLHPLPVNNFTAQGPFCAGSAFDLTNTATVASGHIAFSKWTFGDGTTKTQANSQPAEHVFTNAGSYSITLETSTDKGCSAAPVTKTISVSSLPKAAFQMPGSCLRDPYSQFIDSSTNADGSSLYYNWQFGDTLQPQYNTDTVQHPKHHYIQAGNYSVRLLVRTEMGCADSLTQVLTINGSVPQALFEVADGAQLCNDAPVNIIDKSKTNVGKLTKMELFWNYDGNNRNIMSVPEPVAGKSYQLQPPVLSNTTSKQTTLRMVAYTGQSCFDVIEKVVTINAMPKLHFDSLPVICSADQPFLITQAGVVNDVSGWGIFTGDAVSSNGLFNPAEANTGINQIQYSFKTKEGCSAEINQTIVVASSPRVNAGPDLMVRRNSTQTIKAGSSGNNLVYSWSPAAGLSDPTILQPLLRSHADAVYKLTATTPEGCTATDELKVQAPDNVFIPNAFTPNGDGINDNWRVPFLMAADNAYIQVFNRDGVCVYTARGNADWNGKYKGISMPIGTYVYLIKMETEPQVYKGTLTLVR
jgi:gliding motility-associated-like protein